MRWFIPSRSGIGPDNLLFAKLLGKKKKYIKVMHVILRIDLRIDRVAVIDIGNTYSSLRLVRLVILGGTVPFSEFRSSRLLSE